MNKFIKIIALMLVTIFMLSFTACGNNTSGNGGNGGGQGSEEHTILPNDANAINVGTMSTGDIMLCNFESYKPNINIAGVINGFGKISLNTDKNYVSRGERSARLDPLGWAGTGALPLVYFPTTSVEYDYNFKDFTYIDYITFDMYNDNGKEVAIKAGFIKSITNMEAVTRVNEQEIILEPGWNKDCIIYVDDAILALTADITSLIGVYFMFENAGSLDIVESDNLNERTPRFYLDNLVMVKKSQPNSTTIEITLNENEILDFELLYQKYMVSNDNPSIMEVVNATDYGLVAPSGKRVLRAVLKGNNSGSWKLFRILDKLVQQTALYGMDKETAKRAYICFSTYNNYSEITNLCVDYTIASTNKPFLSTSNYCAPMEWTHYEYAVSDILKAQPDFLSNPGEITINYADSTFDDREYFFDNFRIEFR